MDWEYIGAATGRFFLAIIEYCFKILAVLSSGIALGTPGLFTKKLAAGFTSLTSVIRNVFELPAELNRQAFLIGEYNSMPVSSFSDSYGAQSIDSVFAYFGTVTNYFSRVGDNLSGNFFAAFSATILLFGIFYLLAWVLRFARQKGQGSWKVQLEKRLAEKVFKIPAQAVVTSYTTPDPVSKPKEEIIKTKKLEKQADRDLQPGKPENKKEKSKSDITDKKKKQKPVPKSKMKKKKQVQRKKKKQQKPAPPPPNRNEPAWLTNARKSTKEYKQAQTSDS